MVGVVVGGRSDWHRRGHGGASEQTVAAEDGATAGRGATATTLTIEPGFKSTGLVDGELATIGELSRRAGVATSTVRYYERRGLLRPDGRQSGQRRYRAETMRLLVFIGMLQDAGLSLDDIDGIVNASSIDEWKNIAQRRLGTLDDELARLESARDYLQGALLCRYDHPLTDCAVMGREIDRRLRERP